MSVLLLQNHVFILKSMIQILSNTERFFSDTLFLSVHDTDPPLGEIYVEVSQPVEETKIPIELNPLETFLKAQSSKIFNETEALHTTSLSFREIID